MYGLTAEDSSFMEKTIYSKQHRIMVKRLRKTRKKRGLNQIDVAKLLGVTQSYVSRVESGQRRIDIVELKAFAKLYRKKIEYFLR